ncbi:hypothetical protein BBJ28_00024372 [Nothophytophthora sp. Chile5]|nr:hypothetical protein BBJ28_00024372 [Nothophytophthora sp. Chile5]
MDVTDAFDAISNWEETLIAEGEQLGVERGRELGIEEGRELGCALAWDQAERQTACRSARDRNIVDEDMMNKLLRIRAKFKVITALSGLRTSLVYSQEELNAHKNMSF